MKMSKEHYATLKEAVIKADTDYPYLREMAARGDISAKQFRWDLLYFSRSSDWICRNLYPYLDDTHIDTALRKILKEENANVI